MTNTTDSMQRAALDMRRPNVTVQAISGPIYSQTVGFTQTSPVAEQLIFTMIVNDAPVGALISFSSNTPTGSGAFIGIGWTGVMAPAGGGATNPNFEAGMMIDVNPGYTTVITYQIDFNGAPSPSNFKMQMMVTKSMHGTVPASLDATDDGELDDQAVVVIGTHTTQSAA